MKRSFRTTAVLSILCAIAVLPGATLAATPPTTVNYQGVLRNASDKPLTGTYDMTFRFYDALTAGTEILIDTHAASGSGAVTVTGGLFNTILGGGATTDGSGTGTYLNLGDVFRDYAAVYVEIKVGTETLTPRVRVQASAYAENSTNLGGRSASGYLDTSSAAQTKAGQLTISAGTNGIDATGSTRGGWFKNSGNTSDAELSTNGGWGVYGYGSAIGGEFKDPANDDLQCAYNGYGAIAYGSTAAGLFKNLQHPWVEADLATGANDLVDQWGIYAAGATGPNNAGGGAWLKETQYGGTLVTSEVKLASAGYGAYAHGDVSGGFFQNTTGNGYAYVGYNGYGIEGFGSNAGGYFTDRETAASFYAASNTYGAFAEAPPGGGGQAGYFHNAGTTAYAVLGTDASSPFAGPFGVKAVVSGGCCSQSWAGDFYDSYWGGFARLAYHDGGGSSSISGNAAKNFVQNHPYDRGKTITYSSLEGDEVGTYTRGTGRLVEGVAHVRLGETFQWVTNPDVGLTAQVTARGSASTLYVVSLTTTELVVRGDSGDPGAAFDYVVHGLRVGFEESSVVNDRIAEAKLPAVSEMAELLSERPDLQRYTALSRFREMATSAGLSGAATDMTRGLALRRAIGEYDRTVDRERLVGAVPAPPPHAVPPRLGDTVSPGAGTTPDSASSPLRAVEQGPAPRFVEPARFPANTIPVEVSESVSAGDVLTIDPTGGVALRPATVAADPRAIGIVAGEAGSAWSAVAPIAIAGTIVSCRIDASFGAISAGDLLVTSSTTGHAMRAGDAPAPGTIVGKALEGLPGGQGLIRVLAMAR